MRIDPGFGSTSSAQQTSSITMDTVVKTSLAIQRRNTNREGEYRLARRPPLYRRGNAKLLFNTPVMHPLRSCCLWNHRIIKCLSLNDVSSRQFKRKPPQASPDVKPTILYLKKLGAPSGSLLSCREKLMVPDDVSYANNHNS